MNEELQKKINQIREFAKRSGKVDAEPKQNVLRTADSLLKVIRNKEEAEVFMAELNTAIASAKNK